MSEERQVDMTGKNSSNDLKPSISAEFDPELEDLIPLFVDRIGEETVKSLIATKEIKHGEHDKGLITFSRRFLRAEKKNLDKAVTRAKLHAKWRSEALPRGYIIEEDVSEQLLHRKVFLQTKTQDGRPLLIIRVRAHIAGANSIEYVKRFVVYCLEAAAWHCDSHSCPDAKMYALFDLGDIKWGNLDASALKHCFSVLTEAFPERIFKIYMLDSPIIFDALWRMVSPFIDPVSKEKVKFISGEKGLMILRDAIGLNYLPKEYNGQAEDLQELVVEEVFIRTRETFSIE